MPDFDPMTCNVGSLIELYDRGEPQSLADFASEFVEDRLSKEDIPASLLHAVREAVSLRKRNECIILADIRTEYSVHTKAAIDGALKDAGSFPCSRRAIIRPLACICVALYYERPASSSGEKLRQHERRVKVLKEGISRLTELYSSRYNDGGLEDFKAFLTGRTMQTKST